VPILRSLVAEPQSTWGPRELPILTVALRRLDAGEDVAEFADLANETGLSHDQLWAGLRALETAQPPFIELDGKDIWGVTERARRELGTWPSADSIVDELAAAFAQAAEAEKEPAKKKRLRAVADGLGSALRDIAVGVISKRLGDL
jgi:hypothetical protein